MPEIISGTSNPFSEDESKPDTPDTAKVAALPADEKPKNPIRSKRSANDALEQAAKLIQYAGRHDLAGKIRDLKD